MKLITFLVSLMVSSMMITGCYYDNEEDLYPEKPACDTSIVTYSATIAPIMTQSCNSCHNAAQAQGGVITETHAGLQVIALDGRLHGVVNWAPGFLQMPDGGSKLSDCDLNKIDIWIRAGAPNN